MMTNEEMSKRIDLLERKLNREKCARETAEKALEGYSKQAWLTNLNLEEALTNQTKRTRDLEYLIACASVKDPGITLEDLIREFVEISCQFTQCSAASYSLPSPEKPDTNFEYVFLMNDKTWRREPQINAEIQEQLVTSEGQYKNKNWMICPADFKLSFHDNPMNWLYRFHFKVDNNLQAWLCFFSDQPEVEEETIYVLNTSESIFLNNIQKTLIKARLVRRNEELQATVKELQFAQNQLVQSEKMVVLGQLAAGVAHEINNPMSFIKSNLQILTDYIDEIETCQNYLTAKVNEEGTIDSTTYSQALSNIDYQFIMSDTKEILTSAAEGAKRVSEIIRDLKSFTHRGSGDFTLMDLGDCLNSAIKIAQSGLNKNCIIEKHIPELSMIHASNGQLQQVFINLFVNAGDAMAPNGGTIKVIAEETQNSIIIRVSDTGCGMDELTRNKLFTPFFTTKPVGQGTGLGLSVSFAILESHEATIEVETELNVGTTFIVTFPVKNL
ncbi:sensor histidine kinase [Alteromonas sp. a30]|uniref:sensor histidine kinase n=1 Tax=Alteromonas sp. a30 TaxID=2730917 RepID=UPI002282DF25|nr:ATP-binding protein [Alteromonas sp. a30]MCY7294171.1 HAMP domain-containing histidine kinase [Alteromonas sp. a30]